MCRLVGGGCFFEDFVLVFDNVEKKKKSNFNLYF